MRGRPIAGSVLGIAVLALVATTAQAAPAEIAARLAPPGTIRVLAGGVGGPGIATSVAIGMPCGVTTDGSSVYLADGNFIRQESATGLLTTPVGDGTLGELPGYAPDGTPATSVFFDVLCASAVDPAGNLILTNATQVRVVAATTGTFYGQAMTAGDIYTIAGAGPAGFSGDGGPASQADLRSPRDIAVDGHGNVVIADTGNWRIRVVAATTGTFYGQEMTAGDIYTVAGTGTKGFSGDTGPATDAQLAAALGVAVDPDGNLLVADAARVRVVAASTGPFYGQAMTTGDIYTVAGNGSYPFTGDGGPALSAGMVVQSVVADPKGNLLISDPLSHRIRVVADSTGPFYGQAMTAGDIYTIAGDGSQGAVQDGVPATSAFLYSPRSMAVDQAGNVVIADLSPGIRLVASTSGTFYGQAMIAGDIYTIAGNGAQAYSGDGAAATAAQIAPSVVRVDAAGNTLICDAGNSRIRVVARRDGVFYGQAMRAGRIYTVAGNGQYFFGALDRLPSGIPATAADLGAGGVGIDPARNLLIADSRNNRVRVVASATGRFYGRAMMAGDIYTLGGSRLTGLPGNDNGGPAAKALFDDPTGVVADHHGNVLVTDHKHSQVRVIAHATGTFYGQHMTAGHIYTIAGNGSGTYSGDGGVATAAGLDAPTQSAVDRTGNVVIADTQANRIRVVAVASGTFYGQRMTAGHIYTVAGDGTQAYSGDNGPARSAAIYNPADVAVDPAGNLVLTDVSSRVRVVAALTGTFYGVPMKAGRIYTVAGDGGFGVAVSGQPAIATALLGPSGVAIASGGGLLIADYSHVWMVTS